MNKVFYVFLWIVSLLSVTASATKSVYVPLKGLGQDSTDTQGAFVTHSVPALFPEEGVPLYNVSVNGAYVGLYNDRNHWGGLVHFGFFEFENGREVTLNVTYYKDIQSFEILPGKKLNLLKVKKTSRNSIAITLDQADQNLTVVINKELKKHVLHLFCNSIDHQAPNVTNSKGYHCDEELKLHYFGAGYYDLRDIFGQDMLQVHDGWRVYIASGAVLYGRIGLWNTQKGTKIYGRGMVYNDTHNARVVFEANNCSGADVHGVFFHAHRAQCWQVVLNHCQNIEFKGVKILSTRYASTDGLDIVNCQQCAFLNTFIRANDDAIAIKGLDSKKPENCPPNKNLTFCGMQLWNDCNCAMGIGAENHCVFYENIRFMNSSILFSYDDPDYHEVLDERAALTICCIHGTFFRNISYENIDVYHCERFIAMGFQPSFWFGSLKGDQSTPGGISQILFRNVQSYNDSGSRIANKIHLYGWQAHDDTPDKFVDDVKFEHVMINNKLVDNTLHPAFTETDFKTVRNVTFAP